MVTGAQRQKDALREMATGGGPFGAPPAYDDDEDGDEYGAQSEPEPEPVSDRTCKRPDFTNWM